MTTSSADEKTPINAAPEARMEAPMPGTLASARSFDDSKPRRGHTLSKTLSASDIPDLRIAESNRGIMMVRTLKESLTTSMENCKDEQPRRRLREAVRREGIKFGNVEVREYPITIGDNPGGIRGPPLSIGWKYQSTAAMELERFEESRPPRRTGPQMNIPLAVREEMLRTAGFSRGEIQAAVKKVNISRQRRRRTEETMHLSKMEEVFEKLKRGTLNSTLRRGKKKKERKYIKQALELQQSFENQRLEEDILANSSVENGQDNTAAMSEKSDKEGDDVPRSTEVSSSEASSS